MTITERGTCKIINIDNSYNGVGITPKGYIKLPYTIPGEIVEFEKHRYRNHENAVTKRIIEASSSRAISPCKYFTFCGGCSMQHMDDITYRLTKESVCYNILRSLIQNHTIINPTIFCNPMMRRRISLQAIKKHDKIFIGFCKQHSDKIVDIDTCIASTENIRYIIPHIKNILHRALNDKVKIRIHINDVTNGLDILIQVDSMEFISSKMLLSLSQHCNVTRLQVEDDHSINDIFCKEQPYLLICDKKIPTTPNCFLQANKQADDILQKIVISYFNQSVNANLVDLFCGRGTFSIPLSRYFIIDGFDSDIDAISSLNTSMLVNGFTRDLHANYLTTRDLMRYQYAVINPPRSGAEKQISEISRSNIEKIAYVSCNPETFLRDARILCKSRYQLTSITLVDQFYWSNHMEIVGLFQYIN